MTRGARGGLRKRWSVARMEPTGRANARPMINSAKSGTHATPPPDCAWLHPGYSRLICPLSSLISDFPKNISVPTYPKSLLELRLSHPTRGAYRDRHGRGQGCGGRGSVLLRDVERAKSNDSARNFSPCFGCLQPAKTGQPAFPYPLTGHDPDMPKSTRLTHTAHHACVLAAGGGASRPLPERKQERPRLSATKLKRPRAKWLRPRRRSGSLLRRCTRNRPTRDKPPASRFPTDRPSACWDCWLQGRP